MEINVEQNIKKARRTTYSLMASGLHGHNGLDPETSLQLYKTYVLPKDVDMPYQFATLVVRLAQPRSHYDCEISLGFL
jgi:hypothetical protein